MNKVKFSLKNFVFRKKNSSKYKSYWRGRCFGDECGDDKEDERDTRESLEPVVELDFPVFPK